MKVFFTIIATIVVAVLAGLPNPAAANDDWYQRAVQAAAKARNTPEAQAENHGYATAAYEKVCGDDLVVTDAKLRARKDRLYRNHSAYAYGYNWVVDRWAAMNGSQPQWELYFVIWQTCTGGESAGWAKVPEDRKLMLENKINSMRPR